MQVAVKMRRLPAHTGVSVQPCFERDTQWSKLPLLFETDPCAHRELMRVERHVGVRVEQFEKTRGHTSFARFFQADIEAPGARVVEVEVRFGAAVDVDQCAGVVVTVFRIESKLERAGAAIEHSEGAEVCVFVDRGSLLEDARGSLNQKNWTRKHDRE